MVSDCVFRRVVRSDAHFCVVDDELVVDMFGDIISVGFIERCFCDSGEGIIITKRGEDL